MTAHAIGGHPSHRAPRRPFTFRSLLFWRPALHATVAAVAVSPDRDAPGRDEHPAAPQAPRTHPDTGAQLAGAVAVIADRALRVPLAATFTGASVAGQQWRHGWMHGEDSTRPQKAVTGPPWDAPPEPDGVPEVHHEQPSPAAADTTVNLTARTVTGRSRPYIPGPSEPPVWLRALDPSGNPLGEDDELSGWPLFTRLAPLDGGGGHLAEVSLGACTGGSYVIAAGSRYCRLAALALLAGADALDRENALAAQDEAAASFSAAAAAGAEPAAGGSAEAEAEAPAGNESVAALEQEIYDAQQQLAVLTRGGPVVQQDGAQ